MTPSWLSRALANDAQLAAAHAAAERLGSDVALQLLAASERLARASEQAALAFYRVAPAVWSAFGPHGFARWLAAGEALGRSSAEQYFALAPTAFGPNGAETAQAWAALGLEVTQLARHLGPSFFSRTATLLTAADALPRLRAWVSAGKQLAQHPNVHAGLVADAFFESAPIALAEPALAVQTALAIADAIDPRRFFAAGASQLSAAEQAILFAGVLRLASADTHAASVVYEALPEAALSLPAAARASLFALLAALPAQVASSFAELAPSLRSLLGGVPRPELASALRRLVELAARAPVAALRALASLPELYRRADAAHAAHWFDTGLELARNHGAAAEAYFALESRTSVDVLRRASSAVELEAELGVWRKLIEMLSREPAVIRRCEEASLRPPLEAAADEATVALPARVDWLPRRDDNLAVYRFLAMQLAGRREFGTYRVDLQRALQEPAWLEELFLLAEGARIAHCVARAYPGSAAESAQLAAALIGHWHEAAPARVRFCDVLLALALAPGSRAPAWLPPMAARQLRAPLERLQAPQASVRDSLQVARELALFFQLDAERAEITSADLRTAKAEESSAAPPAAASSSGEAEAPLDDTLEPEEAEAMDAEEHPAQPSAGAPSAAPAAANSSMPSARRARRAQSFVYDEWDHTIGDYRSQHCRVHELPLRNDSGAFFERTVTSYKHILAQVRHQFERMRPDRYRPLRGLEDGEDFDLNALTDARIEARLRRTASTRIYTARTRQTREVATLFLLDMSASTEQPFAEPGEAPARRRIIDTLKEALVVLTTALDVLGDSYAIYGFSSQGRNQVDMYPVKAFDETLNAEVKARIGGIEPKHGTRMGAALRHALTKFSRVHAQSKHLILLSDGFPQDQEYGPDRRSHSYGIEDTAVALRELKRAGTTPFCITVDRAGQDYLRQMCADSQYMVIDQVDELPRELPKIYRRIVPH